MRFEHLVQINDPALPALPLLTREQLWRGLVLRAAQPTWFVLGLESASIHEVVERDGETLLSRTLDFGAFQVRDQVVLTPRVRSVSHTSATAEFPDSSLTIEIEEPWRDQLFLRFTYRMPAQRPDSVCGDRMTDEFRRQAYTSADLDTVQRIRQLAARGVLDESH